MTYVRRLDRKSEELYNVKYWQLERERREVVIAEVNKDDAFWFGIGLDPNHW